MKIQKFWFYQKFALLDGPIVVIDAYCATTNINLILSKKPGKLILANEKNYQKAKRVYKDALVAGESLSAPFIFNLSNMPYEIAESDLAKKVIVYMTVNGTRVFEKFVGQDKKTIACAFNNLKAVAEWLKKYAAVNIILAGDQTRETLDDEICGQMLEKELRNESYNWNDYQERVGEFIKNYYRMPSYWPENLKLVFAKNCYNIVPSGFLNKEGLIEIRPL